MFLDFAVYLSIKSIRIFRIKEGSKDHIHLQLSYAPSISVCDIVKRLQGCSASDLQRIYWLCMDANCLVLLFSVFVLILIENTRN